MRGSKKDVASTWRCLFLHLLWGRSYDSYVWEDAIMEQFISMCSSERERCDDVPVEIGRDPIGSNANIQITYID